MSIYSFFSFIPWSISIILLILVVALPLVARRTPSPEKSEKSFRFLRSEMAKLLQGGVVAQEQYDKIVNYYGGFAEKRAVLQKSRLVRILAICGAFLIGFGVILFIASNWRQIPEIVLVLILTAAVFCSYYFGFRLKYQKASHKHIGSSLVILGGLLYGAALILTAQIYHIDIEFSYLMLVWALGILPVAFLDKSAILFNVAFILTMIWGFTSLTGGSLRDKELTWQFYLSFPLILAFGLPFTYRFKKIQCLIPLLLSGLVWIEPVAIVNWFIAEESSLILNSGFLYLFIGIVLVFIGEVHKRLESLKTFHNVYFSYGATISLFTTLVLTFPFVYQMSSGKEGASFMPVFFNFVFIAEAVALVWFGIKQEEEKFINIGIAAFGVLLAVRYFSLSWSLGSRAIIFIVGGILMIGAGFILDKLRKKAINKAKEMANYAK